MIKEVKARTNLRSSSPQKPRNSSSPSSSFSSTNSKSRVRGRVKSSSIKSAFSSASSQPSSSNRAQASSKLRKLCLAIFEFTTVSLNNARTSSKHRNCDEQEWTRERRHPDRVFVISVASRFFGPAPVLRCSRPWNTCSLVQYLHEEDRDVTFQVVFMCKAVEDHWKGIRQ
jgi:hypothetical protein